MAKSLLVIIRQAPWSGPTAREALDILLAGGAYDLPLSLLFMDDGVFQLCPDQQPARLEQKDLTANLQALPLFGVDSLHAARHSLQERGLEDLQPSLPVSCLSPEEIRTLIQQHDHVITL